MTLMSKSVVELVKSVERGEIGVHAGVQRGFVWKPDKIVKLLDSVYRRYPVGVILLWDVSKLEDVRSVAVTIVEGGVERPRYLVVDGLQRLTSFVLAYRGECRVFSGEGEEGPVYVPKRLLACFDPRTRTIVRGKAIKSCRVCVPIHEILNEKASIFDIAKRYGLSDDEVKAVEKFRGTIASYQVPVYIIEEDITLDDLIEIFNRINSAGTRIEIGHIVLAYLNLIDRELSKRVREYLAKLRREGFPIKVTTINKALSYLATGTTFVNKLRDVISENRDRVKTQLQRGLKLVEKGFENARVLVREQLGISQRRFIAAETPLTALAIIMSRLHERKVSIPPHAREGLAIYFLLATYFGRYTGTTEPKLDEDVREFEKTLEKKGVESAVKALLKKLKDVRGSLEISEHEFKSGKSQKNRMLLYFALYKNGAVDFLRGVKIGPDAKNLTEHHIFPRKLLRDHGYSDAEIDDIANITYILEDSNREIGSKEPAKYLREIDPKILDAHFIPLNQNLWHVNNYREFLEARRRAIVYFVNSVIRQVAEKLGL